MIRIHVPRTNPHVTMTFQLVARHITQDGSGEAGPSAYCIAVASHMDILEIAPTTSVGRQVVEYGERFRGTDCRLVIDAATEGWPFTDNLFRAFHGLLQDSGLDPASVILITTNYDTPEKYNTWASANSLKPMNLFVYDFWCYKSGEQLKSETAQHGELRPKLTNISKKLLSLNRIAKAHRAAILLFLHKNRLMDDCYVSFMSHEKTFGSSDADGLISYYRSLGWPELNGLLDHWEDFSKTIPIVMKEDNATEYLDYVFGNLLWNIYDDVGFAVITESDFGVPNVDRVTEKPFKAIANQCPHILMGQPYQERRLRALGFKPHPMIRVGYDDIEDPNARLAAVLGEVSRLTSLPIRDLNDARNRGADVLYENAVLLQSYGESQKIGELAARLSSSIRQQG